MLIPKDVKILEFFPKLAANTLNPRCHLVFADASGESWEFAFIYYNNRFFGGTRNEYRLTRMTRYIRENDLVQGDQVTLTRSGDQWGVYSTRAKDIASVERGRFVLKLGSGWKIIDL